MRSKNALHPFVPLEHKRDAYGFAVRPQHVQRYREYSNIYKEEEEERSERWKTFIDRISECAELPINGDESLKKDVDKMSMDDNVKAENAALQDESHFENLDLTKAEEVSGKSGAPAVEEKKVHRIQIWSDVRPSLHVIEDMMNLRGRKRNNASSRENCGEAGKHHPPAEENKFVKGASEEDSEEEFYDVERSDLAQDSGENAGSSAKVVNETFLLECSSPWKEELEVLVRGGVPMALRGELWQAFVGVKARRQEKYYQNLLSPESDGRDDLNQEKDHADGLNNGKVGICEKWKGQIEKDLPRTFPGHPALDEDGRNALRRILIAYARHNPSVGYCQAMNFFAGLLLLLMPEENAFWTLMGVLDDYFGGYYSEDMIESQVDQLVFEELVRERFPKLVNHLDYLGVEITWVTGPWFLSIFMNMLPWESVLRVWDVLLFEGNRVMLFKTALALMELYGPALVTTKDAGDAVTLLQSLAGSTFDSSQLVLTACMGYQNVHEARLKDLREKHRPSIKAMIEERAKGLQAWKSSSGLASKLYNFKQESKSKVADEHTNGDSTLESGSTTPDDYPMNIQGGVEVDSGLDLHEQVVWLKVELCKLLEEKRSAELRAEELETALMEMVKQDNRRQLSAKVEQLEQEVSDLHRVLSDKQEQESAMIQVLMRVEQEQKVTEDARRFAEQDAAAQRYAAQVLQEKYEDAMASLATMEKRAVMAESMLEATLQYQSGQVKALSSPRSVVQGDSAVGRNCQETASEPVGRKISLLSRWQNRGKPAQESNETKPPANEVAAPVFEQTEINGHKTEEQQDQTHEG